LYHSHQQNLLENLESRKLDRHPTKNPNFIFKRRIELAEVEVWYVKNHLLVMVASFFSVERVNSLHKPR
jgi:hypothetical protein